MPCTPCHAGFVCARRRVTQDCTRSHTARRAASWSEGRHSKHTQPERLVTRAVVVPPGLRRIGLRVILKCLKTFSWRNRDPASVEEEDPGHSWGLGAETGTDGNESTHQPFCSWVFEGPLNYPPAVTGAENKSYKMARL